MKAYLQEFFRSRWKRTLAIVSLTAIGALILLDQVIMPLAIHSRRTVTMPSVIGMAQEHAVALLNQQGLVVQDIQQQYDSTQPAGRVVLQSPYPGATVRQGRRVYLVVSRGEETVALPSLLGMTLREAQVALIRLGLQLGNVQTTPCELSLPGGIVEQIPPPGARVRIGSSVALVLCQDTAQTVVVPNVLYRSREEAESLLAEAELALGEVVLQRDGTFAPGTVLRQEPAAGSRVPRSTPIRLWVASDL
ncbi:MAG: PASTA domain-containing protein [Chlorobiota bacterium]|jgi:serine/threonine-protein kinase|nr:MAG: PASTA domain-containing protein [Chlorobiota bacterium]